MRLWAPKYCQPQPSDEICAPDPIRHTPGQKEPVLHFTHVSPLMILIQLLQKKLCDDDRASWRSV